MISQNSTSTTEKTQGLDPTIDRLLSLMEQKRSLERQARELDKQAKLLESAIADTVEANGGSLYTERHAVEFSYVKGIPSYKSICEAHIAPGVLQRSIDETPKRRKLVIV